MENVITRKNIIDNVLLRLGGTVVDVELSSQQLDLCVSLAIQKLRQLSDGAVEESFLIYYLKQDQHEYILPEEVINVQQIYRRGFGRNFGSAGNLDPFYYAGFASVYQAGGMFGCTMGTGSLTTYDLYTKYINQAGKMFGKYMNYTFNSTSKKLTLMENPRTDEEYVILHCYVNKPEEELYKDRFASRWIQDWALSEAMLMLAQIRGMFTSMGGPNGSVSMNAGDLRNEAQKLQEQLLKDVHNFITGGSLPAGIYFG